MDAETKELLAELFADNSIGTYSNRNNNGADSYHCSSCGAWKDIQGYAWGPGHITEVEHKPECRLLALYNAVKPLPAD